MPEVGDVLIGKYRLDRLIGVGGMGSVYEARHLKLGKRVAIKIPKEELAEDKKAIARFEREPRSAAATGHRGIVEVHDVETTDDGIPFIVMELLEGESLGMLLKREHTLDVERAVFIVAQVLSALDATHEKGIIHRDLKPDNVFLVDTGHDLPEVKILDFGTSKIVGGNQTDSHLTESGAIMGTPFYMAPEQIADEVEPDQRLDLYAIGVMLYETLTGTLPFKADTIYSLIIKVLNDEVGPPRELNNGIPEALEEAVLRALARDRDDRYSSAASMLRALLPFLDKPTQGRIWLPKILRDVNVVSQPELDVGTAPTTPAEVVVATPDTDVPKITQETHSGRTRLLIAGLTAGLAIIVFFFVNSLFESEPEESPTDSAGTSNSVIAQASPDASKVNREKRVDDVSGTALVTLTIENIPEGGVAYLDRSRLPRRPVSFPPSKVAKQLLVKVGVGEIYRQHITLDEDVSLDLTELMEPNPDEPGESPRADPEKRAPFVKNAEKSSVRAPAKASESQPPEQHTPESKQDPLAPMQWKQGGVQR